MAKYNNLKLPTLPGDLALAPIEKLNNQKLLNAQLSPDMFHKTQ